MSGYGIGLKQAEDQEKYRDEITLEWLFALYCFDSQFKNDLIHIIEQLEIQFRTQISYHLAMKYGADGYLLLENFIPTKDKDGITYHQKAIESFQKEVKQQAGVPFVKHHIEKYGGRFPIWVAVELFTFGRLTSFFSIMKYDDRKAIASYICFPFMGFPQNWRDVLSQ